LAKDEAEEIVLDLDEGLKKKVAIALEKHFQNEIYVLRKRKYQVDAFS
jgi:hypothetical protein